MQPQDQGQPKNPMQAMSMRDAVAGAMPQEEPTEGAGLSVEVDGQPVTDPQAIAAAIMGNPEVMQIITAQMQGGGL